MHFLWVIRGHEYNLEYIVPYVDNKPLFVPTRIGAAFVSVLLLGASFLLYLTTNNVLNYIPERVYDMALGVLCFVMLLRSIGDFRLAGLFKKVKDSKFSEWDTKLYTPLCVYLFISCLYILLKR